MYDLENEIEEWYLNNQEWIDDSYLEKLMLDHGFDVTESSIDLIPCENYIADLFHEQFEQ